MVRACGLLAIFAAAAGAPRPAEACSPPEELSLYPYLGDTSQTIVPTDGVIAFQASATGELADVQALLSITVMQGDAEVEGAIETIVLSTREDWVISHDLIFVWRPSAPFVAAGDYSASVEIANAYAPDEAEPTIHTIDVVIGDGPATAFPAPGLSGGALDKSAEPTGERVCCDNGEYGDCGFGDCMAPIVADRPVLAMTIALGNDPVLSQAFVRMRAGVDGATEPYSVLGLGHEVGELDVIYPFAAAADSYCIAAEIVSLIDGSVSAPVMACVDHGDLVLESAPNPQFEQYIEACIDEPRWEDTEEPYVPGEEEGGSDESGGGLDEDARGCGCDAGARDSLVPGLFAIVVGAALRRRRRA